MKLKKNIKILFILFLFCTGLIYVKADSGWDSSYDSGGWDSDWGDSDWSDSDWGDSDWGSSYGSSSSSYGLFFVFVLFGAIVVYVYSTGYYKNNNNSNSNDSFDYDDIDISKILNDAGLRSDKKAVDAVKKYMQLVKDLPVRYFESKPQRAVDFSEFYDIM